MGESGQGKCDAKVGATPTQSSSITYKLMEKIGSGGYGTLFLGKHTETGEEIAIKLESQSNKNQGLVNEHDVYLQLQGGHGIPRLRFFTQTDGYNALGMDLLGPSIKDHFKACGRQFSLKTVLMLADELLQRLEYIHSKGLVHRDVKPENIVMGTGRRIHCVYLLDFGLSTRYIDRVSHKHIPDGEATKMIGTATYASVNSHERRQLSRRDDLESLAYTLIFLARGDLPWHGLLDKQHKLESYAKIWNCKMKTPIEEICRGIPKQFATFLRYSRELRFDEKPDYLDRLCLFKQLFREMGFKKDFVFDWNMHNIPCVGEE